MSQTQTQTGTETTEPRTAFPPPGETRVVGRGLDRVDARAKVTGQARYAAEFSPPRLAHAVTIRSPIAHGRVRSVDAAAARRASGVVAVFHAGRTLGLASGEGTPDAIVVERIAALPSPDLGSDQITYAGQIVGLVVAETLEEAEHAARLLRITYAPGEAAVTLEQGADRAEAPEERLGAPIQFAKGDAEAALADAPVTVDQTYELAAEHHHPMETHATVARWDGDQLTVWDATQGVIGTRNTLAQSLGVPVSSVRVICPYVGGGFGSKGPVWPHVTLTAAAARAVGRPVKHVLTRQDMTVGTGHRPENTQRVRLGADERGRLVALSHQSRAQTAVSGPYIEPCASVSAASYAAPAIRIRNEVVPLDRPPPCFMRGPGEQPGSFALESAMDELAAALAMDPIDLRLRNQPDAHPISGKPWSLRRTRDCFERGAEMIGWASRGERPRSVREGDWLIGYGCAQAVFPGYRWGGSANVRMDFDGSLTVTAATQDIGTGTYTILAQAAAETLGLDPAQVSVRLGDSDLPQCGSSGGSTTAASVVPAVIAACEALRPKIAGIAARGEDGPLGRVAAADVTVGNGGVSANGRSEDYASLMRRSVNRLSSRDAPEAFAAVDVPPAMQDYALDSSGAQFARVAVHERTGEWRVDGWVGVFDVGRILNEKTARSQFKGGIIYGLGAAMMEATTTDPETGRVVTRGLADYHVPVHADLPEIEVAWLGEPDPVIGPLGNRGIGEIGSVGVSAALANAIFNATGRRLRGLPMVPERIMGAA